MSFLIPMRRGFAKWPAIGALFLSLGLLSACATAPDPAEPEAVREFEEINDPAEPTNRAIFAFNQAVDKAVLKPAAGMYRHLVPPPVRTGIHNALDNLRSPVIFLNDILQGEMERAGNTFMRFVINSTIGILGLRDPATEMGYAYHSEDFGQTLATWGVDEGPYMMLPVFGPSNPRDAVGLAVDFFTDPFNMWAANSNREFATYARGGTRAVDERARNYDALEEMERSSLDFYAAIRSLYRQRRADEINNGTATSIVPSPGLSRTPMGPRRIQQEELSQTK
ncbi:MAG: VacJ family lipoprotein [Rhodospirillales bacterium]|nr:VacJ family lipoprotein [Rhodospirillales bacterium]